MSRFNRISPELFLHIVSPLNVTELLILGEAGTRHDYITSAYQQLTCFLLDITPFKNLNLFNLRKLIKHCLSHCTAKLNYIEVSITNDTGKNTYDLFRLFGTSFPFNWFATRFPNLKKFLLNKPLEAIFYAKYIRELASPSQLTDVTLTFTHADDVSDHIYVIAKSKNIEKIRFNVESATAWKKFYDQVAYRPDFVLKGLKHLEFDCIWIDNNNSRNLLNSKSVLAFVNNVKDQLEQVSISFKYNTSFNLSAATQTMQWFESIKFNPLCDANKKLQFYRLIQNNNGLLEQHNTILKITRD